MGPLSRAKSAMSKQADCLNVLNLLIIQLHIKSPKSGPMSAINSQEILHLKTYVMQLKTFALKLIT